ncbi:MAG: uracil-DNA glycosylase family protein [Chitinophagales bacterium]|nr:uracil-DNA glycosylase family protein [Chitinophagaceae bacterium]MCB9065666.1 uracil-DNA glycosylase family protein [Chitinophagales bacterium]
MKKLIAEIQACTTCAAHLPHGVRPVLQAGTKAKLIIIGQAPGRKVHDSGIPWDDASGNQLRKWLGIDKDLFYNPDVIALVPMGFCYPGKGAGGDLPPRPECAPQWHPSLLKNMKQVQLTLLIGQYAQQHYLKDNIKENLTETVRAHKEYLPKYLPLPHPSPRNRFWLSKNPWFEKEVIPILQDIVKQQVS